MPKSFLQSTRSHLLSPPLSALRILELLNSTSCSRSDSSDHPPVSLSPRRHGFDDETEITENTILFESLDYNHWLITVDMPKNSPAAEKISIYEHIAAQVFGSMEEAKKKIYACSTAEYDGFQVQCSEETSEKFQNVPGVVFVLPDLYIDPVNKQYGGDKYLNGEIIHMPSPIRSNMRRDPRPRRMPVYKNRGQMQREARNFGPPQSHPHKQNFGPHFVSPRNQAHQHNFGPPRSKNPPHQQNFGPPPRNSSFQQNFSPPQSPSEQNFGLQRDPGSQQNHLLPQNCSTS